MFVSLKVFFCWVLLCVCALLSLAREPCISGVLHHCKYRQIDAALHKLPALCCTTVRAGRSVQPCISRMDCVAPL